MSDAATAALVLAAAAISVPLLYLMAKGFTALMKPFEQMTDAPEIREDRRFYEQLPGDQKREASKLARSRKDLADPDQARAAAASARVEWTSWYKMQEHRNRFLVFTAALGLLPLMRFLLGTTGSRLWLSVALFLLVALVNLVILPRWGGDRIRALQETAQLNGWDLGSTEHCTQPHGSSRGRRQLEPCIVQVAGRWPPGHLPSSPREECCG